MNTMAEDVGSSGMMLRRMALKPKARFVCTVCGDDATGYNFGAIVCESCKSFYRRHAHRRPNFRCLANGKCQLNKFSRRFCASCRLRKCFAVGMRVPPVVEEEKPRSIQTNWSSERLTQRRLLVARLLQRIATQRPRISNGTSQPIHVSSYSCSSDISDDDSISCTSSDFQDFYERASVAAKLMRISPDQSYDAIGSSTDSEACVFAALGNYVNALKCFPEFLSLGRSLHASVFQDRLIAQVNLYTVFSVNEQLTGWCALETDGRAREHCFSEFVNCLSQVDAQNYVEAFLALVSSLRSKMQRDWPIVLLTLCLIDLCTDCSNEASRLSLFRINCETFLEDYLNQRYPVTSEPLLHFCLHEFPQSLAHLVDVHRRVLVQMSAEQNDQSDSADLTQLLQPIVSQLVSQLSS